MNNEEKNEMIENTTHQESITNSNNISSTGMIDKTKEEENDIHDEKKEEKEIKNTKKEKKNIKISLLGLVLSLVISIFGGFSGAYLFKKVFPTEIKEKIVYQMVTPVKDSSVTYTSDEEKRIHTVDRIKDSVVEIRTEQVQSNYYFGQYVVSGAGSGVILTEDGYIVTNNHVIEDANNIKVTLRNGKTYDATLIGTDALTDIALIKIEEQGLTVAVLGDSDQLNLGQSSIVIGNPLGELGGSVSTGIISSLSREITMEDGNTMNLLQTTSAVNPGNSGGGIFDSDGYLIGIVNAKSTGDDVEGLGFAIPINHAKKVVEDLMEYGYVTGRPRLGVSIVTISSRQQAFSYGVSEYGLYIYSIEENSAAEQAGLKIGDMILSIDDIEVDYTTNLSSIISNYNVGDKVVIVVKRDRKEMKLEAILKETTHH